MPPRLTHVPSGQHFLTPLPVLGSHEVLLGTFLDVSGTQSYTPVGDLPLEGGAPESQGSCVHHLSRSGHTKQFLMVNPYFFLLPVTCKGMPQGFRGYLPSSFY